jgi:hypothetical protein
MEHLLFEDKTGLVKPDVCFFLDLTFSYFVILNIEASSVTQPEFFSEKFLFFSHVDFCLTSWKWKELVREWLSMRDQYAYKTIAGCCSYQDALTQLVMAEGTPVFSPLLFTLLTFSFPLLLLHSCALLSSLVLTQRRKPASPGGRRKSVDQGPSHFGLPDLPRQNKGS